MKPISSLSQLKQLARELPSQTVSVVRADEVETLSAVREAVTGGMVDCVLVGPEDGIRAAAEEAGFDLNGVRIVPAKDDYESSFLGVDLIRKGEAGVLMKGLVATSAFLKAILDKDHGIRGNGLLSHVAAFEVPSYHKLIIVTDAAMNIAPDFDQKTEMLRNAVTVARSLGIDPPRCTYVCAKEVPYDKMPCTLEADRMQKMADAGEFGDILFPGASRTRPGGKHGVGEDQEGRGSRGGQRRPDAPSRHRGGKRSVQDADLPRRR